MGMQWCTLIASDAVGRLTTLYSTILRETERMAVLVRVLQRNRRNI